MTTSGPGPSGPGPDASALEAARLRVYRPDASAVDRAEYTRLLAEQALQVMEAEAPQTPSSAVAVEAAGDPDVRAGRRPLRVIAVLSGTAVVVLALVVAVLLPHGPEPLPDYLNPPTSTGTTITTIARQSDPATAPDLITYTPQGYTVFQPAGRAVHVSLRCQGAGTVVIAAGRPFVFHCGARLSVLRLAGPATDKPFVVIGTTHGNVVWAVRISLS